MRRVMLLFISFILFSVMASSSCVSIQPASYLAKEDDEISASLREDIHALNDKITALIQNNDFEAFYGYFLSGTKDDSALKQQVNDQFPILVGITQGKTFRSIRDYHCVWQGQGNIPCVILPRDNSDFQTTVERVNDEIFISITQTPNEFNKLLASIVYTRQDNQWKLYKFHVGSYSIADKNAIQWYEEAKSNYDNGYLVPAMFRLQLANSCLQPAPFLRYKQEEEIGDFGKKLQAELSSKYAFPIQLSSVPGNPSIYRLDPQFAEGEMVSIVTYVTSISLDDANALKEEANRMNSIVQEMFPGIGEGATHIVYRAYSEPPLDPKKQYRSYGTLVEVNK